MNSLNDFLKNFNFIPEDSKQAFLKLAKPVTFHKNEILTKTGEIAKKFYIIKKGIVRSYHIDENGKDHIRSFFTAGRTTGSLGSLISKQPSKLSYDCLTDCEFYEFNFNEIKELIEKDPNILMLYSKVLENIYFYMESKIYDLSVLNGTQRYLKLQDQIPDIETLIPQYHIASYLNVSAVQLSRIRKEIYSK